MKTLVAGGSGFIGTQLIARLTAAGHEVTCYDLAVNPALADITIQADVRDREAYTAAATGHDLIINLAAAHRDDVRPVELYQQVNVDGANATIAAAEANGIQRLIFTSTVALYGLDKPASTESDAPEPFNEYGRTKLAAEEVYHRWYQAAPGRQLAIVRPCVVFGEGNRGNVYNLAKQLSTGRFLTVGNGQNRKSMAYVGNVAAFLADLVESTDGDLLVNYADKPDLTTNQLVAILRDALNRHHGQSIHLPLWLGLIGGRVFDLIAWLTRRDLPISTVRIRKFAASTVVDTARLEALGFTRPYSLAEGLRRTVAAEFGPTAG